MDKIRFAALWSRCGGDAAAGGLLFEQLAGHYGEPQRHYHTLEHIAHCLAQLDKIPQEVECAEALELSIWYHDVIYQIGAKDNEQCSADRFMEHSTGVIDEDLRQQVQALIMVTVHPSVPTTPDQCLMVDIDLSSFCLPWPEFLRDSTNVRNEFPHLSDAEFSTGQIRFLRSLMARPWFYNSDYYRQHHEQAAHDNIHRLLLSLQHGEGLPPSPPAV